MRTALRTFSELRRFLGQSRNGPAIANMNRMKEIRVGCRSFQVFEMTQPSLGSRVLGLTGTLAYGTDHGDGSSTQGVQQAASKTNPSYTSRLNAAHPPLSSPPA